MESMSLIIHYILNLYARYLSYQGKELITQGLKEIKCLIQGQIVEFWRQGLNPCLSDVKPFPCSFASPLKEALYETEPSREKWISYSGEG